MLKLGIIGTSWISHEFITAAHETAGLPQKTRKTGGLGRQNKNADPVRRFHRLRLCQQAERRASCRTGQGRHRRR